MVVVPSRPSVQDIAWLAGLLEGEGCFDLALVARRNRRYSYPRITLGMTDRDIVTRASTLLGGSFHTRKTPDNPKHNAAHVALVSGSNAVGWMMTIYKFMGERRKATIRRILASWKATEVPAALSRE